MNEKLYDLIKDGYKQEAIVKCVPYSSGGRLAIPSNILGMHIDKKFIVLVKGNEIIIASVD